MANAEEVFESIRDNVSDIADTFMDDAEAIARAALASSLLFLNQKATDTNIGLTTPGVKTVLRNAGVTQQINNLLGDAYQQIADEIKIAYKDVLGIDVVFDDEQLRQFTQLQEIDAELFDEIINNATSEISRSIKGVQTGTSTIESATRDIEKTITHRLVNNMQTQIDTVTSAFFQNVVFAIAATSALGRFTYVGPLDGKTRPFCVQHTGQTKTKAQWDTLNNGQISPVSVFRGGYNCRHALVPVV